MVRKAIGDIYVTQAINAHTDPYRIVRNSLAMEHIVIHVETQAVKIGREGWQIYPIAADGSLELFNVDLADLWFKNDVASAKVSIIGSVKTTEE